MIEWVAFVLLGAAAVAGALGMLVTMSMYRAAIFLMASFVALAGLFVLLGADLLAAIQVMMNVGGMLVMILFMVPLMMDPGGEMMWDMKRKMDLPGFAALSMAMPRRRPPPSETARAGGAPGAAPSDWTCPMHPEVSAPGPGKCPKCGMDLVPRAEPDGGAPGAKGATRDAASDASAARYSCPMHPEVASEEPGECPKCGMDLAAVAAAAGDEATTYTCPMHPEVASDEPGTCPKCGMELIARDPPEQRDDRGGSRRGSYACPMHREVTSDQPGTCPRCGMDLAPAGQPAAGGAHGGMEHGGGTMEMSPAQHHKMMVDMAMSTELLPWAKGIGAAGALLIGAALARATWPVAAAAPTEDAVVKVGELLLSKYMVAFEGAAYLILAGIVGAVVLAKRERE